MCCIEILHVYFHVCLLVDFTPAIVGLLLLFLAVLPQQTLSGMTETTAVIWIMLFLLVCGAHTTLTNRDPLVKTWLDSVTND